MSAEPPVPSDPLARAFYEWLDPERFLAGGGAVVPARLPAEDLPRLRALLDETAGSGRLPRTPHTVPVREIGPYRLLKRLGGGGYGNVFLAVDQRDGQNVAVKLLRDDIARDDKERQRFHREITAARRVLHPHCVRVLDAGEADGALYAVFERIQGEGLDDLLRRVRSGGTLLGLDQVLAIGVEICDALAAAHAVGVVHRDVKPGNICISLDRRAVLVDFGIAMGSSLSPLTATGEFLGSLPYAAPEQVRDGASVVDHRGDIYSLGATLYECVTGRPPFVGASAQQLVLAIFTDDPLPPDRLNTTLSRGVGTVLLKALERSPRRRYAHVLDLRADLVALREGRAVAARPRGAVRQIEGAIRRRPVGAVLGAVGLLVGVALPLALFASQRSHMGELRRERDQADDARRLADAQWRLADAERLAAHARLERDLDPTLSTLLARASLKRTGTLSGRSALVAALAVLREEKTLSGPWQRLGTMALREDGRSAFVLAREGDLYAIDLDGGQTVLLRQGIAPGAVLAYANGLLLIGGASGNVDRLRVPDTEARVDEATPPFVVGLAGPQELPTLAMGQHRITALAISGTGDRVVATVGSDVVLFDGDTEVGRVRPHAGRVGEVVVTEDGAVVYSAGDDGRVVRISFSNADMDEVARVEGGFAPRLALSRGGEWIAVETPSGVQVIDGRTGAVRHRLATEPDRLASIRFSNDGSQIVTASAAGTVRRYRVRDGALMVSYPGHRTAVRAAAFVGEGLRVATCGSEGDSVVRIFRPTALLDEGLCLRATSPLGFIHRLAGQVLVVTNSGSPPIVWTPGELAREWPGASSEPFVDSVSIAPDERLVILRTADSRLELRALDSGSLIRELGDVDPKIVPAFDRSGAGFFAIVGEELVRMHARTGETQDRVSIPEATAVRPVEIAAAGDVVLVSMPGRVIVYDANGMTRRTEIHLSEEKTAYRLRIAPGVDRVVFMVRRFPSFVFHFAVHSLTDGAELLRSVERESHMSLEFGATPDFGALLYSDNAALCVLSIADGTERRIIHHSAIVAAAMSTDLRRLAVGGVSGQIRVFDTAGMIPLIDIETQQGPIGDLEFEEGGHTLLSSGGDGTLRRIALDQLDDLARERAPRDFTADERARFQVDALGE